MKKKKIWKSKIFWTNIIALGFLIYQNFYGTPLDPKFQITILAVINLALRAITEEKIQW